MKRIILFSIALLQCVALFSQSAQIPSRFNSISELNKFLSHSPTFKCEDTNVELCLTYKNGSYKAYVDGKYYGIYEVDLNPQYSSMALIGMPGLPSGWGPAPMFLRLKGNNTTLELIAIKGEESMSYNSRGYLQSGRTGRTNYNSLSLSSGGISFQPMDRDPGPEVFRFKGFESQSTVSSSTNSVEDNKVYDSVEQEPRFPGGQTALLKYVADHLEYPAIARENGIQGRVIVGFVVKKDGSIGTVRIVRGKDPELDKEAVRVIKTLPRFTPGKMNGHPVNVWYTLPITFKLSDKSTTSEQ